MVATWAAFSVERFPPAAAQTLAVSWGQNWYLVAVILGSGLFWICLHYWSRYRDSIIRAGRRPASLFLELCEAHRLTNPQRALLLRAAETRSLKYSATVFVDPRVLGEMAAGGGPDRALYKELSAKLFGEEGQ